MEERSFLKKTFYLTVISAFLSYPGHAAADSYDSWGEEDAKVSEGDIRLGVGIEITGDRPEARRIANNDPMEPMNRSIYVFNETVDDIFLEPVARSYRAVVPEWGRARVGNFLSNLFEPITFLNSLLQLDVENSFVSFWRFVLNTTIGIGGIFDQASIAGLERRSEDFDQTMAVYGVKSGPFIMLPILGPSTARGTAGLIVDSLSNPFNYGASEVVISKFGAQIVDNKEARLDTMDEIERTSFDPYATIRSAYIQHRTNAINNGKKQ